MRETIPFALAWRLHVIDFLLDEYGYVNRSAVVKCFDISEQQASNDLTTYKQIAPRNMEYDQSAKRYIRTPDFKRAF